ncbi:uncharacterized protein LOC122301979 [Carya illinoinensis]|uniref:uncharacterized protein LOC122301979 n=1 Tax=Carya illinoinensis TaxID=32201 RepID=UPI001C723F7B|nr:uncharacterized protein LOC122301979 [Carya illinoinensis]
MSKCRCSTTILLRKQSSSTVKHSHRTLTIKRLSITALRTRSYWPYFLRSSNSSSYKVQSEWKKFKNSDCSNYNILCTIFAQAVVTGMLHFVSTQEPPPPKKRSSIWRMN